MVLSRLIDELVDTCGKALLEVGSYSHPHAFTLQRNKLHQVVLVVITLTQKKLEGYSAMQTRDIPRKLLHALRRVLRKKRRGVKEGGISTGYTSAVV